MELKKTERGFECIEFKDTYGIKCSLQKSSLATKNAIWFGTDVTDLIIFEDENRGKYIKTKMPVTFSVNTRMHLTQEQVKELLPYLQRFVEVGEIS